MARPGIRGRDRIRHGTAMRGVIRGFCRVGFYPTMRGWEVGLVGSNPTLRMLNWNTTFRHQIDETVAN